MNDRFIALLKEEKKPILVRIKGTKDAAGKDLYSMGWFEEYFPDKSNITGIAKGSSGSSIFGQKEINVQFAIIKDGEVIKTAGQARSFKVSQLEEI